MLALSLSNKDNFKFSSSHCPLNPLKRCSFCNEKSYEIALGAGLSKKEAMAAIVDNPRELLKSKGIL